MSRQSPCHNQPVGLEPIYLLKARPEPYTGVGRAIVGEVPVCPQWDCNLIAGSFKIYAQFTDEIGSAELALLAKHASKTGPWYFERRGKRIVPEHYVEKTVKKDFQEVE